MTACESQTPHFFDWFVQYQDHIFCSKLKELMDKQTDDIERAFTMDASPYLTTPITSKIQKHGLKKHQTERTCNSTDP